MLDQFMGFNSPDSPFANFNDNERTAWGGSSRPGW